MDGWAEDAGEITEKHPRDRGNRSRWKLSVGVSVGKVSGKPAGSICVHIRIAAALSWNSIPKTPPSPCSLSLDRGPQFISQCLIYFSARRNITTGQTLLPPLPVQTFRGGPPWGTWPVHHSRGTSPIATSLRPRRSSRRRGTEWRAPAAPKGQAGSTPG